MCFYHFHEKNFCYTSVSYNCRNKMQLTLNFQKVKISDERKPEKIKLGSGFCFSIKVARNQTPNGQRNPQLWPLLTATLR